MKYASKVTRNYQVTIPSEIREKLNIKEGDYVVFELRGDEVVIKAYKKPWTTISLGRKVSVEEIEEIADKVFEDDSS
ncbi:AbrB/MazE/SpoVT family DNA-binding domain-containing protein [Sulfolobus tengchongensis]|uniref:AbrB/MazE/SpoVT family DNA-binding domain-containing protein n=1 Tax=Sulfolobus tengchongensis TaxID=207809 RepID=A0AAX4KZU2_9CREN